MQNEPIFLDLRDYRERSSEVGATRSPTRSEAGPRLDWTAPAPLLEMTRRRSWCDHVGERAPGTQLTRQQSTPQSTAPASARPLVAPAASPQARPAAAAARSRIARTKPFFGRKNLYMFDLWKQTSCAKAHFETCRTRWVIDLAWTDGPSMRCPAQSGRRGLARPGKPARLHEPGLWARTRSAAGPWGRAVPR